MYPDPPEEPRSSSVLPVFFGVLTLVTIAFLATILFTAIFGTILRFVVLTFLVVIGMGMLQYWLWGKSLDKQTEGEREEDKVAKQMEEESW